jgi:acyl-CoA thioester hydrolase
MPAVFHYAYRVTAEDGDELGHANNLSYLRWAVDAAMAHSTAQGWPGERYHSAGCGWVVRTHQIEYRQPAFPGDDILVRTWVADMKRVTSLRRYRIVRMDAGDEVVLAVAATDWAFIDFKTRIPKRIPVEVSSAFELVPEDPPPLTDDCPRF